MERDDEEYAYNLNAKRRKEEEAHQLANSQSQLLLQQSKDNARVQLHERESTHADGLYTKRCHLTSTLLETAMAGQHNRLMEIVKEKSYAEISTSRLAATSTSSSTGVEAKAAAKALAKAEAKAAAKAAAAAVAKAAELAAAAAAASEEDGSDSGNDSDSDSKVEDHTDFFTA